MSFRVAQDRELVQCATHKVQRLAKFCTPEFVYNADRVPVNVLYRCQSSTTCSRQNTAGAAGAGGTTGFSLSDNVQDTRMTSERLNMLEGGNSAGTGTATNNSAAPQQGGGAAPAAGGGGAAKGRYYDLTQMASQRTGPKKVCWACGMSDHEKPTCPNILCKRCHGKLRSSNSDPAESYQHNHFCEEPNPSPFILLDYTLLTTNSELMSTVRCVRCDEFGHFDCSTTDDVNAAKAYSGSSEAAGETSSMAAAAKHMSRSPPSLVPHCSYCGLKGHHGFDCPKQDFPDRWVQGVRAVGRRAGYIDASGAPAYSAAPSTAAVAPPQYATAGRTGGNSFQDTNRSYNNAAVSSGGGGGRRYTAQQEYFTPSSNVHMEDSRHGGGGGGSYYQANRQQRDNNSQRNFNNNFNNSSSGYNNNNNSNNRSGGGRYNAPVQSYNDSYGGQQNFSRQQQQFNAHSNFNNNRNSYFNPNNSDSQSNQKHHHHSHNREQGSDRSHRHGQHHQHSNNNNSSRKRRRYSSSDDDDDRMQF